MTDERWRALLGQVLVATGSPFPVLCGHLVSPGGGGNLRRNTVLPLSAIISRTLYLSLLPVLLSLHGVGVGLIYGRN